MAETTVTISADEYFELREKAQINVYLSDQLRMLESKNYEFENHIFAIEQRIDSIDRYIEANMSIRKEQRNAGKID